jgi:hypothetical protein
MNGVTRVLERDGALVHYVLDVTKGSWNFGGIAVTWRRQACLGNLHGDEKDLGSEPA